MVLRVLVVISTDARRGAEIEGSQLADQLRALGHDARCVALRSVAGGALQVEVLGRSRFAWRTLRRLRSLASAHDVVLAYGADALPACAIALTGSGAPFVYRSIGDPVKWVRGAAHRMRTGWLFRRAAHVVALWPRAAADIVRLYGVPPRCVSCLPNARPQRTDSPHRDGARLELGLPSAGAVVALVGSLSAEKRPLLAVESAALAGAVHLLVVGDGPLAHQVGERCAELLPGRFTLLGVQQSLVNVWAACDLVLLTSATEGMPGVLIEAQLAGVPAVATDVGAVALVVADRRTGRVVGTESSAADIATAITDVLADHAHMSSAAAEHAQQFTWPYVAPEWVELLSRCTAASFARRRGRA